MNDRILRIIAIIGTVFFVMKHIVWGQPIGHNQSFSYYSLSYTAVGLALTLGIFKKSTNKLFHRPDILIPIGIYIIAIETLFLLFPQIIENVSFESLYYITDISIYLVLSIILNFFLASVFAGWQTLLILQLVKGEKIEPTATLKRIKLWLPKTFVATLIGNGVVVFFISLLFALFSISAANIYIYIWATAILSLGWNLLTALLLPNILDSDGNIFSLINLSFKLSLKHIKNLVIPVIIQLFIIGWIMFVSVEFERSSKFGESNPQSMNTFRSTIVWTGDYPHESKWNELVMNTVKAKTIKSVDLKLSLLLLLLAVVIKIQIISIVWGNKESEFRLVENNIKQKQIGFITLVLILFCLLPLEKVVSEFDLKNLFNNQKISDTEIENNPYFDKELIFEIPENKMFQVTGKIEPSKIDIYSINDLAVGELDNEVGQDTFVLSGKNVLVLNEENKLKKIINLKIKTPNYSDGSYSSYGEGEIIDVDDDGICEFLMHENFAGSPFGELRQSIFNQDGELIWETYSGEEYEELSDKSNVKLLVSGNLDRTKVSTLFIIGKDGIKPFELKSDKGLKLIYLDKYKVYQDSDNSKLLAVDIKNRTIIENTVDEPIKKQKKPTSNVGYMFDSKGQPLSIYFNDNKMGLFDFDGKLISKFYAPESEKEFGFFEKYKSRFAGDKRVSIFEVDGEEFKSSVTEKENLAILALQRVIRFDFNGMLYIYDYDGKLLLRDHFKDSSSMKLVVALQEDNKKDLLVIDKDKIWKYKAK